MGKKYMDTKKGSLEQSILDVWKEAAEELPVQPQTEHGSGEHAFEVGTKRFDDYTREITPGQIEEALELSEEDFDKLLESMTYEQLESFEEGIVSYVQSRTGLGPGGKVKRAQHLKRKASKIAAKASAAQDIDKAKAKIAGAKQKAKQYKQQKKDAKRTAADIDAAGGMKNWKAQSNSYEPEGEETISEAASPDWAQPRNLRDTVIAMWTEASSAVDPKEREELDAGGGATGEGGKKTAAKMKRAKEPAPMVATEEVEELDEKLSPGQKKLDVDKDGEIEGSDLAKLRKKAKKEGKDELEVAKEFKAASMKEALAKVWGYEEGYNPYGKKGKKKMETVKKAGNKTDTGEDMAAIDLDPKIKEKK